MNLLRIRAELRPVLILWATATAAALALFPLLFQFSPHAAGYGPRWFLPTYYSICAVYGLIVLTGISATVVIITSEFESGNWTNILAQPVHRAIVFHEKIIAAGMVLGSVMLVEYSAHLANPNAGLHWPSIVFMHLSVPIFCLVTLAIIPLLAYNLQRSFSTLLAGCIIILLLLYVQYLIDWDIDYAKQGSELRGFMLIVTCFCATVCYLVAQIRFDHLEVR